MRFLGLHIFLLLLTGCANTPEVSPSPHTATTKIHTNKTEAENARDEYKALQDQRDKE